jgi:hypothetical protein
VCVVGRWCGVANARNIGEWGTFCAIEKARRARCVCVSVCPKTARIRVIQSMEASVRLGDASNRERGQSLRRSNRGERGVCGVGDV